MARVDIGAQTDPRQLPRLAGGDVAKQLGDHPLRQVVGLDAVLHRQLLQPRHQAPVAANHPPHQTLMGQVVKAAALAVALTGGIHQGQVARCLFSEKALLQGNGDLLGETDADEAARGQVGVVRDARHRSGGGHDLAHSGYSKAIEQH